MDSNVESSNHIVESKGEMKGNEGKKPNNDVNLKEKFNKRGFGLLQGKKFQSGSVYCGWCTGCPGTG